MSVAALQAIESERVLSTYARAPVEFVRGEGSRLWDAEGNEYLGLLCGISVTSLGHCNPRVVEAVREQVGSLMHVSNLFYTEPSMRLAERLSELSLCGKVFLCNSGAEANEAAIARPQGPSRARSWSSMGPPRRTMGAPRRPRRRPSRPPSRRWCPASRGRATACGARRRRRRAHGRGDARADPG